MAVQRGVPRGEGLPRLARLAPSLACSRARVLLTTQCPVLLSTCVGRAGAGEGPLPVPGVRQLLGGGGAEQLLALLPLDLVHHLRQTLQDRTMSNGFFRFSILKLAPPKNKCNLTCAKVILLKCPNKISHYHALYVFIQRRQKGTSNAMLKWPMKV